MNLGKLTVAYGLSDEQVNFCKVNGLIDLLAIEMHFVHSGSFKGLAGWSLETDRVLRDMLSKERERQQLKRARRVRRVSSYLTRPLPEPAPPFRTLAGPLTASIDPDLSQLATLYGLSVRAVNVCENAGLHTLSQIRGFTSLHGDFKELRNCGVKTKMELRRLLDQTAEAGHANGQLDRSGTAAFSKDMEAICTAQYQYLGTQAREILNEHIDQPTAESIIRFFTKQGPRLLKLPGARSGVMRELRSMRKNIFNALAVRTTERSAELGSPTPLHQWAYCHAVEPALLSASLQADGRIDLLKFVDRYLRATWKGSRYEVYRMLLMGNGSELTLESIAKSVVLTRERVRQLLMKMDKDVISRLRVLTDLPGILDQYPTLTSSSRWMIFNRSAVAPLTEVEGSSCSPLLVAYIAVAVNSPRLQLVKWADLFDRSRASKELDHTNPLLMDSSILGCVKQATLRAVHTIALARKNNETISLLDLTADSDPANASEMVALLGELLPLRYPTIRMDGSMAHLPPNEKHTQVVQLEEVLKILNEPTHVTRIHEAWKKHLPSQPSSVESIRALVSRHPERFFSIGRTSTYGLRRWEDERPDLKGGTIRDIVAGLLQDSTVPLHLDDLLEEIQKYRPTTNLGSVKLNLQLESSGRFSLFPGGLVGLGGRVYEQLPALPARIPGSLTRRSVLERFIGSHRNELAAYFVSKSEASSKRIERFIDDAIARQRIICDASDIITGITPNEQENDLLVDGGELPFEW